MLGLFFAILALGWGSEVQLGAKLRVLGPSLLQVVVLEAILVPSWVQNRDLEAQEEGKGVRPSPGRGEQGLTTVPFVQWSHVRPSCVQ